MSEQVEYYIFDCNNPDDMQDFDDLVERINTSTELKVIEVTIVTKD